MPAAWHEGDRVRVRGRTWTIAAVLPHDDCTELRLRGDADSPPLAVLCPFDRPAPVEMPRRPRRVKRRRWLHAVRRLACDAAPLGAIGDGHAISILPYQLEPALAMLRHGATRVLLADGVGLGKTIQAGLLIAALAARIPSLRAVVVTPAGLRAQWAAELRDRFGIDATVAGTDWLRASGRDLPPDVVPWSVPGIFITSYDFLKRPEVLRPVEDLVWDLVVVDEAHNAAPATARRAAVHAVSSRSARVLLLTATPDNGEPGHFESLRSIGAPAGHADDIVIFRRSRADVSGTAARRTTLLTVAPTPAEQQMHRALDRYVAVLRQSDVAAGRLVAVVLKKRALSSAASLADSVRHRMALLGGAAGPRQAALPLGDEDPVEDGAPDAALGLPGLADPTTERRLLSRVAAAAGNVSRESKREFLLRLLARIGEPAIVFTEYRDTLRRLERALVAAGHEVSVIHGGLPPLERADAVRRFKRGGSVLLATDAAAEGLNLHERCRLVVHFELPWNPMRLEQRAGRVDRIGQRGRPHEILLVSAHRAERLVLAPLARRAARMQRAGGAALAACGAITEAAVAAAIIDGSALPDPAGGAITPGRELDLAAEAATEGARVEQVRAWRAVSAPRGDDPASVLVTFAARRRAGPAAWYLFKLRLRTLAGQIVHEETIAAGPGERGERLHDRLARRTVAICAAHADTQCAIAGRLLLLGHGVRATARALVQPGLFERRALRSFEASERAASSVAADLAARAADAAAARRLVPEVELAAVLLT